VRLAHEVSAEADRGQRFDPPLRTDELAFYDAVATNESAVTEMGEGTLADIARALVRSVRASITVDWQSRDDVRAKLRSTIKRLLAVYGYPPDAAPEAISQVLRQMETYAEEWSPAADR
jgi:type I restriction enzyme R subunit